MSAREDAIAVFCEFDADRDSMNDYFDAYAHELAEKIRNSEQLQDWTDGHMNDCYMAADLIDPQTDIA